MPMFMRFSFKRESAFYPAAVFPARLPAAGLHQVLFFKLTDIEALHGIAELFGRFQHNFRILVVRGGLHDGPSTLRGIARLENSGADKDRFGAELHDQRSIGRRGDTSG